VANLKAQVMGKIDHLKKLSLDMRKYIQDLVAVQGVCIYVISIYHWMLQLLLLFVSANEFSTGFDLLTLNINPILKDMMIKTPTLTSI